MITSSFLNTLLNIQAIIAFFFFFFFSLSLEGRVAGTVECCNCISPYEEMSIAVSIEQNIEGLQKRVLSQDTLISRLPHLCTCMVT